jgi:hypothetical protein
MFTGLFLCFECYCVAVKVSYVVIDNTVLADATVRSIETWRNAPTGKPFHVGGPLCA